MLIKSSLEDLIRSTRLIAFDFDGVFTDNTVYVLEDGTEAVRCWRSDGLGLKKLTELGLTAIVISTETNPVVSTRCRKLGISCIQSCNDKLETLKALMKDMRISTEQIAFVGNDINDKTCLEFVGLPIVVQDAHPDVTRLARYQTSIGGGFGAVREICDLFQRIRHLPEE